MQKQNIVVGCNNDFFFKLSNYLKEYGNVYLQEIISPENLYQEVVEVEERIVLKKNDSNEHDSPRVVTGTTGEEVGFIRIISTNFIFAFIFWLSRNVLELIKKSVFD